MHIRSILTLIAAAASGCSSMEERQPAYKARSTEWTATPNGVGAIRVGMSIEELRNVGGDVPAANASAECSYVRPSAAPPGVLVMLSRGQVARIDIDSGGVASDAGIAVGESAARVTSAYAGRVMATPHKYVPGGQYLTVKSTSRADSTRRLVFEIENGRVTRFRSGRVPEVEWVERCG